MLTHELDEFDVGGFELFGVFAEKVRNFNSNTPRIFHVEEKADFGESVHKLNIAPRVLTACIPLERPLIDSLANSGESEVAETQVERELLVIDRFLVAEPEILLDKDGIVRNPVEGVVDLADSELEPCRYVVGHQVVGQVGNRVPQGAEFPVEHGQDSVFEGVENDIIESEVTVHEAYSLLFRALS